MDAVRLQHEIRRNVQAMNDTVLDIDKWTEEISKKDVALKGQTTENKVISNIVVS